MASTRFARALGAPMVLVVVTALGVTLTLPGNAGARDRSLLTAADVSRAVPVGASLIAPIGRRQSSDTVLRIAETLPRMRALQRAHPGSYLIAYLKGRSRWQVSVFTAGGRREIGQVLIDDRSGRVLEQWTGPQVAWTMARGYPGAFGVHVSALYVWIPLCLLFVLPLIDPRRPLSLWHLDLLMLVAFSGSLAFFNHGALDASVPLAYPPLLYLLVRMLAVARPGRRAGKAVVLPPLRTWLAPRWLAVLLVFLVGFRVALDAVDSNVIDVGYAGVLGAQRIVDGAALYGHWPADNQHGDTYGPVSYESYIPFLAAFGFRGRWDDLPAAHVASVVFDLLALALLFLLGRRVRGPTLGLLLAYAWVAYPFTLYAQESNTNDVLVAVLVLAALLLAGRAPARGGLSALAALTKFAPLGLAPLLATHGLRGAPRRAQVRGLLAFALAFVLTTAVVFVPGLTHNSLATFWQRTFVYQANRGSPFSLWGLYEGLGGAQLAVQIAAVGLAIGLALVPRRADLAGLAAAAAAIVIALQLGLDHWFYLYIPWFFPLVMVALLGRHAEPGPSAGGPSEPARSRRLAAP